MPDEEVVVDPGQEADQSEPVEDVVEGFEEEGDKPAEETPAKKEAEPKPEESESPLKGEVEGLKRQIHDLNRALHQERTKKKDEEEPLSPEQLKALLKEHKDDPETLFNLMNYIGEQAAAKKSKESINTQRISEIKTKSEELIYNKYPVLKDTSSPYSQQAERIKQELHLTDHPAGTYLAASVIIMNELDKVKQAEYERGKQDGLKGLSDDKRKQSIRESSPMPDKKSPAAKEGLSSGLKSTADQMGLTPSQRKILARLTGKGA